MRLEQTWRWYGPADPVTLSDVKQAGATGVVSALHQIPIGEVWPEEAIRARKAEIEGAGLRWSVVESVPVHEAIKQGAAAREPYVANYQQTIRNLAACGITKLCYNFMPIIDWTRTDLEYAWPDGSRALAFDMVDFVAFELHLLQREGAWHEYPEELKARASARFEEMSAEKRDAITKCIIAGLPGRMVEAYTLDEFKKQLSAYANIDADTLRANLVHFLRAIVPVAAEVGVYLAIHPDDPPMPLLGLPRVVSTASDVQHILRAVDDVHNGLTFCVGSYASSARNDVEAMAEEFAGRTHFLHLRNVRRLDASGSFVEADHLDGEVDMFRVLRCFLHERRRRAAEGWADSALPFRPDHGHQMLDDLKGKRTNPGYSAIGRLRGLAELRGLEEGIVRSEEARAAAGGEEKGEAKRRRAK